MAVDLTAAALAIALGTDEPVATRLLAVATEAVERYAPDAPSATQNEAVIRCAGWLAEQPTAAVRSESVGDVSTAFAPSHASALRHSGAMALLSLWKVRRGGAVG